MKKLYCSSISSDNVRKLISLKLLRINETNIEIYNLMTRKAENIKAICATIFFWFLCVIFLFLGLYICIAFRTFSLGISIIFLGYIFEIIALIKNGNYLSKKKYKEIFRGILKK